jgi:hypothetical protein
MTFAINMLNDTLPLHTKNSQPSSQVYVNVLQLNVTMSIKHHIKKVTKVEE